MRMKGKVEDLPVCTLFNVIGPELDLQTIRYE
jgi:hypothetical protein